MKTYRVFSLKYSFGLMLLWFLLSIFYIIISSDISPSILSYHHSQNEADILKLDGDYLRGKFTAKENNLGIVSFDFSKVHSVSDNTSTFRIKNAGSYEWLSSSEQNAEAFILAKRYPFGFPVITNSKGNVYEFELYLPTMSDQVAVSIDTFITSYTFSTNPLGEGFLENISKKIIYSFTFTENYKHFILFSIPFVTYTIALPILLKFNVIQETTIISIARRVFTTIRKNKFLNLFVLFALIDTLFFVGQSAILLILGICFWIIHLRVRKIAPQRSFFLTSILLLLTMTFNLFGFENIKNLMSVWAYCILSIGVVQSLIAINLEK